MESKKILLKKDTVVSVTLFFLVALGIAKGFISELTYLSGLVIFGLPTIYSIYLEYEMMWLKGEFKLRDYISVTLTWCGIILIVCYFHFGSFPFWREVFSVIENALHTKLLS